MTNHLDLPSLQDRSHLLITQPCNHNRMQLRDE